MVDTTTFAALRKPESSDHVRLWEHIGDLADDVDDQFALPIKFVHLSRSAAVQAIANSTNTYLSWTHLIGTDTTGAGTTPTVTSYTVPSGLAGMWHIESFARFATASATGLRVMQLEISGAIRTPEWRDIGSATGSALPAMSIVTDIRLAAADVVKIIVFQSSGGSMNIEFAAADAIAAPFLKCRYLGP